jgi:hypothetical protein
MFSVMVSHFVILISNNRTALFVDSYYKPRPGLRGARTRLSYYRNGIFLKNLFFESHSIDVKSNKSIGNSQNRTNFLVRVLQVDLCDFFPNVVSTCPLICENIILQNKTLSRTLKKIISIHSIVFTLETVILILTKNLLLKSMSKVVIYFHKCKITQVQFIVLIFI